MENVDPVWIVDMLPQSTTRTVTARSLIARTAKAIAARIANVASASAATSELDVPDRQLIFLIRATLSKSSPRQNWVLQSSA